MFPIVSQFRLATVAHHIFVAINLCDDLAVADQCLVRYISKEQKMSRKTKDRLAMATYVVFCKSRAMVVKCKLFYIAVSEE